MFDFYFRGKCMKIKEKIIETHDIEDYEVMTDDGWEDVTQAHLTVEFDVWIIETLKRSLRCADEHILINSKYEEVFVKDLSIGDVVKTEDGNERITKITKTNDSEHMYDFSVDSKNHTYFTNGFLSHNTTTTACYALWYALFNKNKTVYILANKEESAIEILDRIKVAYEMLPYWMQPGIGDGGYNKKSIQLANGSKIRVSATSPSAIRGRSVNCVTGDAIITVKNKKTGLVEKIIFEELERRLTK
jgi:hypothetical protein